MRLALLRLSALASDAIISVALRTGSAWISNLVDLAAHTTPTTALWRISSPILAVFARCCREDGRPCAIFILHAPITAPPTG